jgi:DNA-binding transcriptional ArsR family regulator
MDLTGREERFALDVDFAASFEFLVGLCAFGLPEDYETYEASIARFENIRTRASAGLLNALRAMGSDSGKTWVNLLGLAVREPVARDVPALIERIEALPAIDLRLYLLGFHVPAYQESITPDALRRAAEGDVPAQDRLIADRSYFGGRAGEMLRPLLAMDAEETRTVALRVLRGWYGEVFREEEATTVPILQRDAEAKRRLASDMTPEALIEAASGIQYTPDPSIRQVVLIPQLAMRPWVLLCEHDDVRLFCYPVSDESLGADAGAPPGRLVRLHRALGDEKRLRMLKALATSSATLQELADRFGLPKSTAHHHLAILRAAGLVRVTSDYERRYSVRRETLPDASRLVEAYLEGRQT